MAKILYRVGEGANLEALPRGTRIGDTIHLTEAEALYERDMGRLIDVEAEKAGIVEIEARAATEVAASELRTAEADGIVKTPVAGDTLDVTEGEADAPKIERD